MLLAVDIGNTNITLGVFDKEKIIEIYRLVSDRQISQKEYENLFFSTLKKYKITDCIIGSVVDELTQTIQLAIDNIFQLNSMLLNSNLNYGIKVITKNPSEAGADRIANAYGAHKLYCKPAIIVDLGTATTFDIINKDGDFIGGVIMAGLNLQLKSLYSNTSKLPKIEIEEIDNVIGTDTKTSILSGVIRGAACAIDGLIEECEKELGEKMLIVGTGGYSGFISQYMKRKFDIMNPNLTLDGLRLIYELNK